MNAGRARLAIGPGHSVWVLEVPEGFPKTDRHAHHAIQIGYVLAGTSVLDCADGQFTDPAVAVAADSPHWLDARGLMVLIFVDPESPQGRAINTLLFGSGMAAIVDHDRLAPHLAGLEAAFSADFEPSRLLEAGRAALAELVPDAAAEPTDPRILTVIERAIARLDGRPALAQLGDGINLSHSRLRHLFVEQTGLPFKSYVLWLRLKRALEVYSAGSSLTESAHAGGFADSAHLSRTFRRTFGLPATALRRF
jgi:AraC-like DNA-binding protein